MMLDTKDQRLISLVCGERGISTEDPRVSEFAEDRGNADDTINRCIDAGKIKQVGNGDTDNYSLEPWWWPYASAEQFQALKGRAIPTHDAETAALSSIPTPASDTETMG